MQRRKYLAAIGSLAAAGAAGIGTGAFTSVRAKRQMDVQVAGDNDALLVLKPEDTENADEYVEKEDGKLKIDVQTDGNEDHTSSSGVNKHADTLIRDLFKISNQGSQGVYVYPSGLPSGMKMYVDDENGGFDNYGTGKGENQGAFSFSSNLSPDDIDDDQGTGKEEAAPYLKPGQTVENISIGISTPEFEGIDGPITINAVSQEEIDDREGE